MKLQRLLDELEDFNQNATLYVAAPTPFYITGEIQPYTTLKDRLALVYSVQKPRETCNVREMRYFLKTSIGQYFVGQHRDWEAHRQTYIHLGTEKYPGCPISKVVQSHDASQVYFIPGIPDVVW